MSIAMQVPTPDGRELEVLVAGPEDGFPLVSNHGTPQAAVPDPVLDDPAAERGLRVISYSRPGYGRSSPHPAPTATVADDVADVTTILDHLGLERFLSIGWSGGGPRSLGCAALLPERCVAAVCGVGLVPYAEYDGDVRDGMGEENVAEFSAAIAGEEAITRWMEENSGQLADITGDQVAAALGSLAPPVDAAALTGAVAEQVAETFRRAMLQGYVGWLHDDMTMVRPWGFSVRDIRVPVAVWQGTEDKMVPFAHAEWLIANVPGARPHLAEGEGHLSLRNRMPDILDDLLDLAGMSPTSR
jgi:pimeloyl-ACP methyl ester carboxylesterase